MCACLCGFRKCVYVSIVYMDFFLSVMPERGHCPGLVACGD